LGTGPEAGENTIAWVVYHPAVVLLNECGNRLAVGFHSPDSSGFIRFHESTVAGDICAQDCDNFALYTFRHKITYSLLQSRHPKYSHISLRTSESIGKSIRTIPISATTAIADKIILFRTFGSPTPSLALPVSIVSEDAELALSCIPVGMVRKTKPLHTQR